MGSFLFLFILVYLCIMAYMSDYIITIGIEERVWCYSGIHFITFRCYGLCFALSFCLFLYLCVQVSYPVNADKNHFGLGIDEFRCSEYQ